jgi:hypothetical protein
VAEASPTTRKSFMMARLNWTFGKSDAPQWQTTALIHCQRVGARFVIASDRSGRWVVTDKEGHVGGTFVNKLAALRFALEEAKYNSAPTVAR